MDPFRADILILENKYIKPLNLPTLSAADPRFLCNFVQPHKLSNFGAQQSA